MRKITEIFIRRHAGGNRKQNGLGPAVIIFSTDRAGCTEFGQQFIQLIRFNGENQKVGIKRALSFAGYERNVAFCRKIFKFFRCRSVGIIYFGKSEEICFLNVAKSSSVSSSIFYDTKSQDQNNSFYSIHPIYAISDKYASYKDFSNAYITIEGSPDRLDEVKRILESTGLRVAYLPAQDKSAYHAACVMASNLVCGMYSAAVSTLVSQGLQEEVAEEMLKEQCCTSNTLAGSK